MYYFGEITTILSVLIALSQLAMAIALIGYLTKAKWHQKLSQWIQKRYLWLGLIVGIFAVSGSLYYSEIAGLAPCKLCWFQRIFIYPQLVLFAAALIKKAKDIAIYSTGLAIFGWVIAAYHYTIQMSETVRSVGESVIPCSTVGMTPSCSSYWFLKFGYITIPMMSLTTLTLFLVLAAYQKNK